MLEMSVTTATATADATTTSGGFLTEEDVFVRVGLHLILGKLHTSLGKYVFLPGFDIFLDSYIANRSATAKTY